MSGGSHGRQRAEAVTGDPRHGAVVAGIPVADAGPAGAASLVVADALARRGRVYIFVNAHSAKLRRDDSSYAAALLDGRMTVGLPDGASVTALARVTGQGALRRCPGPDATEACCAAAAAAGLPVFLLGGLPGVAAQLGSALVERHPGLVLAGALSPPFGVWGPSDDEAIRVAVADSGARIVLVGVSAPKQEVWAYRNVAGLAMPAVCVGAAFDFLSGRVSRAPLWMRRAGLEWAYRLGRDPRRMWRRYLVGNALFLWDAVRMGARRLDAMP